MTKRYCECDHPEERHAKGWCQGLIYVIIDDDYQWDTCRCEGFVMDNLRYVEDRAKAKGLI